MRPPYLRSLIALAAVAGGAASAQDSPTSQAAAQPAQPVMVLSDTIEYCAHLQHMIQDAPVRATDINVLLNEGRRMCEHGEVRRGVARLRTALWLMHHRVAAP
jgi:hypothetical protein